ncbi:hypothetical protein [Janthinobacterium sp. ROICE36]|uniref:hypothetical protein n=1 Tax=Janthinobacterium sp. ROICE36 TaxID=2048670 RepID=UPI0011AFA254|nr:hypothetical protein [Janthinobacterium sp. ROICE36]
MSQDENEAVSTPMITAAIRTVRPIFRFTVSRDEEHVNLIIEDGGRLFDLGERIHHYALLILVRQHMQDVRGGLDSGSCGWIDCTDLAKMLGLDLCHLNVQIFRLRRQILASGLPPAQGLSFIERRRGQLRAVAMSVAILQGVGAEFEELSSPMHL